jgi:hypothetical protein
MSAADVALFLVILSLGGDKKSHYFCLRFVNDMGGLQNLEKYNFSSNHNFKGLG